MLFKGKHLIQQHSRKWVLLVSIILVLTVSLGVSVCYMIVRSTQTTYEFTGAKVECSVEETVLNYCDSRGAEVSHSKIITVTNKGNTPAYVRLYMDWHTSDRSNAGDNQNVYYASTYVYSNGSKASNYQEIYRNNFDFVDLYSTPSSYKNNLPVRNEIHFHEFNSKNNNWKIGSDGYLYYLKPVPAGETAQIGYHIEHGYIYGPDPGNNRVVLQAFAEGIQAAEGGAARNEAWGSSIKDMAGNPITFS